MNDNLISIIVPVYNVEKYLRRCVDSLINQTYHNLEIILVDDGSPDKCGDICDEYAARDSRVKVIHKENAGVTEARISGFEVSAGEYISFIDSDDYVCSDYIEHLYGLIKKYHVELACCQFYNVYDGKLVPDIRETAGYFDRKRIENLLSTNFLFDSSTKKAAFFPGQCTKLMSRKWVSDALYKSRGLMWGEDVTMLLYILYRIPSFYISSALKYYYVQHEGQTTRSADINVWNNLVEHWKSIVEIDSKNYLVEQLSYRILQYVKVYVKNNLNLQIPYYYFKKNISKAVANEIVGKYFLDYHYPKLSTSDKFFLWLIQHQKYGILYLLGKIAVRAYNIIKKRNLKN